ncbi:MAG: NAD-dependent epimerase/dehydratase family protein [Deltaproteobacteria bacterium]|nr:NAD-dependent epimerase/dehydratase family protein [Deltaproteobacteria bacterium]MBW2120272.1 NAD-dependent epimerase/dehydratase family protein [Deltaproteobacteria bacterium]
MEGLLARGEEVRCLVRSDRLLGWIQGMDVETRRGDITDFSSLLSPVKGVDRVYHVGGVTKATDPGTFYRTNTQGTENLIRACIEANPNLERFVYLSSQAAVGPCRGDGRSVETDPCRPVSNYGRSKLEGEEAVLRARDLLKVVVLRASAVYGPRDRDFLHLFRSIARRIEIDLRATEQRLSLCYVEDLVSALITAGEADIPSGEIFFISDGNVYSWHDVARTIAEALGVRAFRLSLPVGFFRCAAGVADWISKRSGKPQIFGRERYQELIQRNWCCDSGKAVAELGFSPSFDLRRGIAATVDWYRTEGWLAA